MSKPTLDGDACPMCLGRLRRQEVCPECGADLAPVLDLYEDRPGEMDEGT